MKQLQRSTRALFLGILTISLVATGGSALAGSCGSTHDIVDTAVENGSFKTLVAAVQAADLVDALKGDGPFTVFAPSDEAFAKLPAGTIDNLLKPENKQTLISILTYHVVPQKVNSSDVKPGRVTTLQGSEIKISRDGSGLMVDQARIVATDVQASNGVIHVIDAVIMPESLRSATDSGDATEIAQADW